MTALRTGWYSVLLSASLLGGASTLAAQEAAPARPLRLAIGDVLRMVDTASENVGIARTGVRASGGRLVQARSGWLPQLSGAATYTRTLESQFEALQGDGDSNGTGPEPPAPVDCTRFRPNPTLTTAERLDSLERGLDCTANGNGDIDFSKLPFGQANQWSFGLDLQQTIFDPTLGPRIRQAAAGEAAALASLASARSGAVLEAAEAYYDALLAARLAEIADSTLAQTERSFSDTELAFRVGNAAEFDLLRATVARDNQRPQVIQRRTAETLAFLRLRQLLDLPAGTPIELTTPLGDTTTIALPEFARQVAAGGDTAVSSRAVVRAAGAALDAAEAQADASRGQRLPTVRLSSAYSKLTFPEEVFGWKQFLTDWNVAVRVSVPLFTGGRIRGQVIEAEAVAEEARLRLRQVRESASREAVEVRDRLEAAVAIFEASRATAGQASRAHAIAEIRAREGISTLTDLADARLQLEQAEANRAQAARDLQVARLRALLLRDLPLGAGAIGTAGAP